MWRRIIQLIIIAIPLGIFVYLIVVDIAPSGQKVVTYEIGSQSPYINHLQPDERVSEIKTSEAGERYVEILDEPVYFSVNLPKTDFDEIQVEVEFASDDQPILELGALVDIFSQGYDLQPLQNLIIENSTWQRIQAFDTTLLDRTGKVSSLDDFFDHLPAREKIATYHFDFIEPFRLADYKPAVEEQKLNISLRGYHAYLTYIKNENLALHATYSDMNRTLGEDEVVVRVWNENDELVLERKAVDDDNKTENQVSSKHQIDFSVSNLPEGVYKVELSGTSDIFWRELVTPQKYLTFIDRIYLADQTGFTDAPQFVKFFTNIKDVTLEIDHASAMQVVTIGSQRVEVGRTHEKIKAKISDVGTVQGFSPTGDIKITGNGKYAFSEAAFFDPDAARLTSQADLDTRNIDYVLTNYQAPEKNGWSKNSATFDLNQVARQDGSLHFVISALGIESNGATVAIHAINLRFIKSPLTFQEFIKQVRERLPLGL